MSKSFGLEIAGKTDTGLIRSQNEDAIVMDAEHAFAILADGMGGYNAGEVASAMASDAIKEVLKTELRNPAATTGKRQKRSRYVQHLVVDAIQKANREIIDAAREDSQYQGMGTTVVVIVFNAGKLVVAHVGDSRVYRFRGKKLQRITRDHSLLQEQIDAGLIDEEAARLSHHKNLVTRAVGVGLAMEVEVHEHAVESDDMFLMCSDGLSDMVDDDEIRRILSGEGESLESLCDDLVRQANKNGGYDNVSVILARIKETGSGAGGVMERILDWIG